MGSTNIIVREYLESLKEDKELDYLFPILLREMGFRIVVTPKEAKGQSQYGKDVIAIGRDENNILHRYYFEIKGFDAKDITQSNYSVEDGVRESIIESKDTAFNDQSIPEFNDLPIRIVFVHNGILKPNIRNTFDGFISSTFPNGGFERWDIYKLEELFSKYLFGENLLTDEESIFFLKRVLILLDTPGYDFIDFKKLVNKQVEQVNVIKGRAFKKFFASLNLVSVITYHYSKESNNLYPAKQCINYLLLVVWAWILREKLETKKSVLNEYRKLLKIQFDIYHEYFEKTLQVAMQENGLHNNAGGPFEEVGYPLRSFDYLCDLIYYFRLCEYEQDFSCRFPESEILNIRRKQKVILKDLVHNNSGCVRPVLDNHSIPIIQVFLFLLDEREFEDDDLDFVAKFLYSVLDSIVITKNLRGRFPELYNNKEALIDFVSSGTRPENYTDSSSLLITILFEFIAIIDWNEGYLDYREFFLNNVNLQIAYPRIDLDIEQTLFERTLDEELFVETHISLPDDFQDFKSKIKLKEVGSIVYRTDNAGFPFLRILAHFYFKSDFFPSEWRILLNK